MSRSLPIQLNSVFQISKRQIYFQDVTFGMENKVNLQRMLELEKSGGPSMLMNALIYGFKPFFKTDRKSIQGNDDTTRVFGLNTHLAPPTMYYNFPKTVLKNVQKNNGLFEVSLQYSDPDHQWNPDKLICSIAGNGTDAISTVETDNLFFAYLKKRKASKLEINQMFTAMCVKNLPVPKKNEESSEYKEYFINGNPEEGLRAVHLDEYEKLIINANENLPSFTDIEFGLFFFLLDVSKRYNMSCVLNGGHLIKTEKIADDLAELLSLKNAKDDKAYDKKLKEFMDATKGDTETPSRSALIVDSFRQLPLFDLIFQQKSEFMERNFGALCVKIDAYLLNLVKPTDKLGMILQFPFALGRAPRLMTLLISLDNDGNIKIEDPFIDATDPCSLTAKTVDKSLADSIKYSGTPSASLFLLENPEEMEGKFNDALKQLTKLKKEDSSDNQTFINMVETVYSVFGDPSAKVKFLNNKPLALSSKGDDWESHVKTMQVSGFLLSSTDIRADGPNVKFKDDPDFDDLMYGYGQEPEEIPYIEVPAAPDDYHWNPILTVELSDKFSKKRKLNHLPEGFPEPVAFPEHIGAASRFNPMNKNWERMREEDFKSWSRSLKLWNNWPI